MFLHEAGRGGRADAIVRSLVELAHGLGLETVAEGVESKLAWEAARRARLRPRPGLLPRPPDARRRSWPTGSRGRGRSSPSSADTRLEDWQPHPAAAATAHDRPDGQARRSSTSSPRRTRRPRRRRSTSVSTGSQSAAASRPTTAAPIPASAAWTTAWRRIDDQSGSTPPRSRNDGRKIATERERRAGDPVRRRLLDRAEVRREREERPGHRLREPVAGEELLLTRPSRARRPRRGAAAGRRGRRRTRARRSGTSRRRARRPVPACRVRGRAAARGAAHAKAARHAESRSACGSRTARVRPGGRVPARKATTPDERRRARSPPPARRSRPRERNGGRGGGQREPRDRSGASERRIASTASATTGTATSSRPCTHPAPATSAEPTASASTVIATADGSVKPTHAARPPEASGAARADRDPELARRRARQEVRDRDELGELAARRASAAGRRTRRRK